MKRIFLLIVTLLAACGIRAQVSTENYVRTRTMLNEGGTSYSDRIDYYDGLGRPFQSVEKYTKTGTVQSTRLASLQEYDAAGRATNSWLPVPVTADFLAPATLKSTAQGSGAYNDTRPYTQPVYEASLLNRKTQEYGPGAAWYSASRPVKTEYLTNTASSPLDCKVYTVGSGYSLNTGDNYPANELYVVKTTDEDRRVSYTFTDKLGRMVLSRQMNGSETHDTYYVYDDRSNLCFVLQPMYQSSANLAQYAFQYRYDSRNRCIYKQVPGAGYIEYTYDTADRPTFSQDGVQRAAGKYTFYEYDTFSRLVCQGECTGKNANTNRVVHIQNYYDSYGFIDSTGFTASQFTADATGHGTGKLTGSVLTVLGSSSKVYTAYYYDEKGRESKSVRSNLLGGYDVKVTTYTFSSQPATVTITHTASGKSTQTEVYTYTYDYADRVSKVKHSLNGTQVTLADYTYDAYGRQATQMFHGNSGNKLTYSYNLRSWLTGISGSKLTQNLYYNTGNGTAQYGGNISSMTWKAGSETTTRGYKFTYDGLSRMLNATYGEGTAISTNANRFSENVTAYDKNGNIKTLLRYGQTAASTYGLVDNLTYILTGNLLNRVDDATTATAYGTATAFSNGANAAGEYAYDANGNLTKDLNKGISNIQYNVLNLPGVVTYSDGSTITYSYAADGSKLRTVHVVSGTTTQTDYCGNVIYEGGAQKYLLTQVGYVNLSGTKQYHYYLKDHQGNNRVVMNQNGTTVEETNHYYPFGGLFASTNIQPFKYNGKELDMKKSLNWYDYGARHYDPVLGRFATVDPLADKYYSIGVYAYCINNPVKFIDPDGRIIGTVIGTIFGGVKGGYDAYKSGQDIWAGAAEGAVSGAITGAAIDLTVGATIASGGGALVVIGAGATAGAVGGAVGGIVGDVTGQVVSQRSNDEISISMDNFQEKAINGAVAGVISGVTSGVAGNIGKIAQKSTQTIQQTMSKNISSTASSLTEMGASTNAINSVVSDISKGMGSVGNNTSNFVWKLDAGTSAVTEFTLKITEDKWKQK